LTIVVRRPETERKREEDKGWRLDLHGTDLRWANLGVTLHGGYGAQPEGEIIEVPHLKGADLSDAHLEGANLLDAHFEGAFLWDAHLEGADLAGTHFEGALLRRAYFEGATLLETHFEDAYLSEAHFEGANLSEADGLSPKQLASAFGDAWTQLPAEMAWPAHWPPPAPDEDEDRGTA
jgi:uncharacterized protein YjbI with pentapeptide repeats